jgi:hypothetical protein
MWQYVYAGGQNTDAAYQIPLPQAPDHLFEFRSLSLVLRIFLSGFFS